MFSPGYGHGERVVKCFDVMMFSNQDNARERRVRAAEQLLTLKIGC
jgi:hypothetical protein